MTILLDQMMKDVLQRMVGSQVLLTIYICVCVCVRRRYAVAISVALLVQYINFWRNSSEAVVKRDFLPLVWRHAIDKLTLNDHPQNRLQTLSNGFGPFGMTKRASFGMASLSSVGYIRISVKLCQ